jgi:ribosomal protein S3
LLFWSIRGCGIARTDCGKYGKTSCNVFNHKIDYALAEESTRNGISGVKVRILYSQNRGDVLYLKRTKYSKYSKCRCSRGREPDGTQLGFGRYGTKSSRSGRLTGWHFYRNSTSDS